MNYRSGFRVTSSRILSDRGKKNFVDPFSPYAWLVEKELTSGGTVEDTGVIFLTNRECPFKCLMCDLWKNTTDETVPPGAIPGQIIRALGMMPEVRHIKLYNSGSFFDQRAIPRDDYGRIAEILRGLKTVIVESHPHFIDNNCISFSRMLDARLEVAIGLEVADMKFLRMLNKKMTPEDFRDSTLFLRKHGIPTRTFILLRPPYMSEDEGIRHAIKSIDFAFSSGTECCTVIPVRAGNGIMDKLQKQGHFTPPAIRSLEEVIEYGISLKAGRVFADTWDLERSIRCHKCDPLRIRRIGEMNLTQEIPPPVMCTCS